MSSLGQSTERAGGGVVAAERLATVQGLLADDLAWVEAALVEAAEAGPAPATLAARHLVLRGGKRVRPVSLLLSAACFGAIPPAAREMAVVSELVHSATLLHDDVIDDAGERRGVPASRVVWGNAVSVLSGDLFLVHALDRTSRFAPDLMPDLIGTLKSLVHGEIIQLRGRTALDLSEATYERILRDKTASLFSWATRTGARLGGASLEQQQRLAAFGERVGMAFQLIDDVLDYTGEDTGKSLFIDLGEGKVTLPLVLAVGRDPQLWGPLRQIYEGDQTPVQAVSRAVIDSGACEETRRRAAELTRSALDALASVEQGPARKLLEEVARALVGRAG